MAGKELARCPLLELTPNRAVKLEILYTKQHGLLERLRVHEWNLEQLYLQKSQCGIEVPLSILNGIRTEQRSIDEIENVLSKLDQQISELLKMSSGPAESKAENGADHEFKTVIDIDGVQHLVAAPYPCLGRSTTVMLPDGGIQNTNYYGGGFEIRSHMKTGIGMRLGFFRHGRRISPAVDQIEHRLVLPLGPHAFLPKFTVSTRELETIDTIPADRIAAGEWTILQPSLPRQTITSFEYPVMRNDFVMTTQLIYADGREIWMVQAEGQPIRIWFYFGDLNVAPAVNESRLAIAFPLIDAAQSRPVRTTITDELEPSIQPTQPNLRRALVEKFSIEELRTLCADLDVNFDCLEGEGKEGKARELISYLDRRGRLSGLVDALRLERPGSI